MKNRNFTRLTFLCTAVYFVSYLSRINLAAVMVDLVHSGFTARQTAALALTLCSIAYGTGQILSGWLGDKFKPQNIILVGFLLTAAMNLSVSLLENARLLPVLWAINGLAQACMWPPLVAIMAIHLDQEAYSRACVWVNWGSAFATIAIYLGSPLLIRWGSFQTVFACSGIAALAMAGLWKVLFSLWFGGEAKSEAVIGEAPQQPKAEPFTRNALVLMGLVMVAIVLQGALRDGVTNWMPTFVCESFGLDSSSAILTGVLLPIFQILCSQAAAWLFRKFHSQEALTSGVIFAVGTAAAVLLALVLRSSVALSALFMAALAGCMHGVNFVLIGMVPRQFRRFGRVGLVSGVLNSCTYLGSALSTYGVALLSLSLGWTGTITLWIAIALAGAVICFAIVKQWGSFRRDDA